MSTGPRAKRQFAGAASDPAQRQITAFFSKAEPAPTSSSSTRTNSPERAPLNGPKLPAHVQSNLLSVGMRVRKSVPEGYKTGTYSGFSLWSDTDSNGGTNRADARPVPAVPDMGGNRELTPFCGDYKGRELTPFCGIHKVGGLAVQETAATTYYSPRSMPSSQESVMSNSSVTSAMEATSQAAMNRKRFFEEMDMSRSTAGWFPETTSHKPGNVNVWRNRADWLEGEISPRSPMPMEWGDNTVTTNGRVMAVPKSRMGTPKSNLNGNGFLLPPGAPSSAQGDQENSMVMDDSDW
ncbi:putative ribonucleotide reductase [Naviculisporaceae sp. PSN 640]